MWINKNRYPAMDGEPHLGYITDCELIEEPGEGLEILLEYIVENGDVPAEFTAIDDMTELDIMLDTENYLESWQISKINWCLENCEPEDITVERLKALVEG